MIRPDILYEDAELIVVKKPAGVDAQESRGSAPDMVSILKNHLLIQIQVLHLKEKKELVQHLEMMIHQYILMIQIII